MQRVAVIGASGQIGARVVRELNNRGVAVVAVGRTPLAREYPEVVFRRIAAYTREGLVAALTGCDAAIATVGLPYRASAWKQHWPALVSHVVEAVGESGIPLTILDNLYVYGPASGPLGESARLAPVSRKGEARLEGARIISAAQQARQDMVLCRAADFFGPGAETTVLPWAAITRAVNGHARSVRWFGNATVLHSFSLPSDVAGALVDVCVMPELRGRAVLHLPAIQAFSGTTLRHTLSQISGRTLRLGVVGRPLLRCAGAFNVAAREQIEMLYQFERDYLIDDSRFRSLSPSNPQRALGDILAKARSSPAR